METLQLLLMCSVFFTVCKSSENLSVPVENEKRRIKRNHFPGSEYKVPQTKHLNNMLPLKLSIQQTNSPVVKDVRSRKLNLRLNGQRVFAPVEEKSKIFKSPKIDNESDHIIRIFKNPEPPMHEVANLTNQIKHEQMIDTKPEKNDTRNSTVEASSRRNNKKVTTLEEPNHYIPNENDNNKVVGKTLPQKLLENHVEFFEETDTEDFKNVTPKLSDANGNYVNPQSDKLNVNKITENAKIDESKNDHNLGDNKNLKNLKEPSLDLKSDTYHGIKNQHVLIKNETQHKNMSSLVGNMKGGKPSIFKETVMTSETIKPIFKTEIKAAKTVDINVFPEGFNNSEINKNGQPKLNSFGSNSNFTIPKINPFMNKTQIEFSHVQQQDDTHRAAPDEVELGLIYVENIKNDPNETVVIENRRVEEVVERYNDPPNDQQVQEKMEYIPQTWKNGLHHNNPARDPYQLIPYVYNNIPRNGFNSLNMYKPDYAHATVIENPFESVVKNNPEYYNYRMPQSHYNPCLHNNHVSDPYEKPLYYNICGGLINKQQQSNNVGTPGNIYQYGDRHKDRIWRTWKDTQITIRRNKGSERKPFEFGIDKVLHTPNINNRVVRK